MNVTTISLIDVIKHYFHYSDSDFDKQGKRLYLTKCPIHNEKNGTSMALYNKTEQGEGWDWTCFGACGTGGTAPKLLVDAGLFPSIDEAVNDMRKVFHLEPPDKLTVETFADYKGFSSDFLRKRGFEDTENGIAFPFHDALGNVVAKKQRLKFEGKNKFNFLMGSNTIYGLDLLETYPDDVIFICEGETDTLTAMQAGLPAVGLPGVNSWQDNWQDLLVRFHKKVAVPDQDKAGQQMVKSLREIFKKNLYCAYIPRHFNDVSEFFLYGCNRNIETLYKHFTTQTLVPATPDTFVQEVIVNNTVLSDQQAWYNIFNSYDGNEVDILLFIERLKEETKLPATIINKAFKPCLSKYQAANRQAADSDANIFIRDGSYWKTIYTKDGRQDIQLSNFTIDLLHTIEVDGDHLRICRLTNNDGLISRAVRFDSSTLTKPVDFMAECKAAGNYIFKGDFADLIALNELLLKQEENIVHSPAYIGKIEDNWLMGSYGVSKNGNIVDADDNGIIEMDEKRYIVRNLNVEDEDDDNYLPRKPDNVEVTNKYLRDVAYTMLRNLGSFDAWMALGFTVAGWHSDEIFHHNGDKSYPILFISGKRNSGKTYLARWLMSAFGFPHMEGKGFSMPTVVSMVRKMGYYSSLPTWYDDYRNNIKDIKYRNEFLLGAYNRQGADKGTRSGFGVRAEKIRGTLLISGEDTPQDNAVLSRCMVINVSAYQRDDSQLVHMLELADHFPTMGHHFLVDKQRNGSGNILSMLDFIQGILVEQGIDGRLAKNAATFAAGFLAGFGHVIDDSDKQRFLDWLCINAAVVRDTTNKEHVVSIFFDDCLVLIDRGYLDKGKHFLIEDGKIYIWFKAWYDEWCRQYGTEIKRTVLLDYIKKEPYIVEFDKMKRLSSSDAAKRTLVLDYYKLDNPDFTAYCEENDDLKSEY